MSNTSACVFFRPIGPDPDIEEDPISIVAKGYIKRIISYNEEEDIITLLFEQQLVSL